MSAWIDVKPDHVPELLGEHGIFGQLKLAIATRLETMSPLDAPHYAGAAASMLGIMAAIQWVPRPVGQLA
jgi:hypothetical protein